MNTPPTRRQVLRWGAALGGSLLLAGCGLNKAARLDPDAPVNRLDGQAVTSPAIATTAAWKAQAPREAVTSTSRCDVSGAAGRRHPGATPRG